MTCPDATVLVDLDLALGEDPEATLRHILACADCRSVLATSNAVRRLLDGSAEMRQGFTDSVMEARARSVERQGAGKVPALVGRSGWWVLHVALAGATGLAASAAAGTATPLDVGPAALGLSLVAGAMTVLGLRKEAATPE